MTKTEKYLLYALIIFIAEAGLYQIYSYKDYTIDDAYITYRYAGQILEGNGIVYNEGNRVEGYSSPLHLLLLVMLGAAGMPLPAAGKLLGLLAYAGILALFFYNFFAKSRYGNVTELPAFLLGLTILATSFQLTFYAVTGMETVMYAFLATALFFKVSNKPAIDITTVILSFLVFTGRAEGFMIVAAIFIFLLFSPPPERQYEGKRLLKNLLSKKEYINIALFLLLVSGFLLWRYFYFGSLLPNTFYAKLPWAHFGAQVPWMWRGLEDIALFLQMNSGAAMLVIILLALLIKGTKKSIIFLFLLYFIVYLIFQKYAGDDWMLGARFLTPVLPAFTAAFIISFSSVLQQFEEKRKKYWVSAGVIMLTVFLLNGNIMETERFQENRDQYPHCVMTSKGLEEIGKWIDTHFPDNYKLVNWRIGAIGYFSGNYTLDIYGLVDRKAAEMRASDKGAELTDFDRNDYIISYFLTMEPELIIEKCKPEDPPAQGYTLIHTGSNGSECLGIWLREDLVKLHFPAEQNSLE